MIRHILLILKRSNIVKSTVSHVILNQITLLFFFLKQLQFFWKVYLDPTQKPAPSWLVSSIGRALHWYRRGHGFKSHTGLNFFFFPPGLISTTCLVVFIAARIAYNLDHLPPQTIVGYSRQIIKEAIRKLKMATRINYINGDCLWQTPWPKVWWTLDRRVILLVNSGSGKWNLLCTDEPLWLQMMPLKNQSYIFHDGHNSSNLNAFNDGSCSPCLLRDSNK